MSEFLCPYSSLIFWCPVTFFSPICVFIGQFLKAFISIRNLSRISTTIYMLPFNAAFNKLIFVDFCFFSLLSVMLYSHCSFREKAPLYNLIAFSGLWVDSQYVLFCHRAESYSGCCSG